MLTIKDLVVSIDGKTVLNGINLTVNHGEIHAIMGPNGSGKTTLSQAIMGHPKYIIERGSIVFNNEAITQLTPDKRARLGLFLAFQYPKEIPGVKLATFLRSIYSIAHEKLSPIAFKKILDQAMIELKVDPALAERYLNAGFSGGEKKKSEMLQMALLQPRLAVLDETDSGLDIDALRIVCQGVNNLYAKTQLGVLLITHYNRILDYIQPQVVHVLIDGKIVRSGGKDFAQEIEAKGYDWLRS
ncbi:MAG: Fe-S cluster assembly ATPase SufC [Candidatus Kerfeldbacteria bacterium]|nr:Fe-S cluster assembly ATPase SufC [Candidatus Kerfeldbacteria bacterium]